MRGADVGLFRAAVLLVMSLTGAVCPAESRYADLDGHRVHYLDSGEGEPTLVFIHGWTCDGTFWNAQVPAFQGKHRLIRVDLPGHGKSDQPRIEYSQHLFARAVEAILEDAGAKSVVLIGHSMGGPVVRETLRLVPEKVVVGIVLLDVVHFPNPSPLDLEQQTAKWMERLKGRNFKEQAGKFIDSMFVPNTPASLREEIKAKMLSTPQRVAMSAIRGILAKHVWDPFRTEAPTLAVFSGRRDNTAREAIEVNYPNLTYEVWDGADHFFMMSQPERFNRLLADFLTKNGL